MTTNPVKVIREKCLRCCCDSVKEVELCPIEACPLWPFRMGKNPYRKKTELTDEQRKAASERMKALRAKIANKNDREIDASVLDEEST